LNRNRVNAGSSDFDRARDDLFSYIHRCGVLKSSPEHQTEWLDETIEYLAECYSSLEKPQLQELRTIGLRFCRPVIDNVQAEEEKAQERGEEGSEEASVAAA
jgi:hypothetical protein